MSEVGLALPFTSTVFWCVGEQRITCLLIAANEVKTDACQADSRIPDGLRAGVVRNSIKLCRRRGTEFVHTVVEALRENRTGQGSEMERLKGRDMAAQRVLKQRMDALERQKLSSTSAHDQDIRDLKRDLETMQRRRSTSLQVSQKPLMSVERRVSLTSSPHMNDVGAASKNKEGEVKYQRSLSLSTRHDEEGDLLQQMAKVLHTASTENEPPRPGLGDSSKLRDLLHTAQSELEVRSSEGSTFAAGKGYEIEGHPMSTASEGSRPDERHRRDSTVSAERESESNEVWSEVRKCRYIRGYDPPEMRMPKDIIGFVFAENQALVGEEDPEATVATK